MPKPVLVCGDEGTLTHRRRRLLGREIVGTADQAERVHARGDRTGGDEDDLLTSEPASSEDVDERPERLGIQLSPSDARERRGADLDNDPAPAGDGTADPRSGISVRL